METISVLEYSALDQDALSALVASYYPSDHDARNPDYLDWLYKRNPLGEGLFAIAEAEGEYVGMTGLVPFRFGCGSRDLDAFMALHVLVHPKAQGRRLFSKLITAITEFLAPKSCFLFGHPNVAAVKSWKRAQMAFTSGYGLFAAMPTRLMRAKANYGIRSGGDLASLDFSALGDWQRGLQQPVLAADAEFLRWRFLEHPTQKYRLEFLTHDNQVQGYVVRRPFRYPGLEFVVDWQGDAFWRRGVPGRLTRATLIGWPLRSPGGYSRKPLSIQRIPRVQKEYPFFCTPLGVDDAPKDWDMLTFAITDFF